MLFFYEENTWDWNMHQPTQVLYDNDAEQDQILAPCMFENSSNTTSIAAKTSPTVAEVNEVKSQSRHRVRRSPTWMKIMR